MSNPLNPNYKPGVGRLVTDRLDFQNHVDGYSFNHNANNIILNPPIIINDVSVNNIQDAIAALESFVIPQDLTVSDATLSTKGIVQLNGDIGGTATNVKVTKIQGRPISNDIPSDGEILTWDQNITAWRPIASSASFIASGDIFGNNTSQTVIGIQGRAISNALPDDNDVLTWDYNANTWAPMSVHPTGDGFASVTADRIDSVATTNIRYVGGKFQTDTSIQFNNNGITGDISWTPFAAPKTLTLPDATDTLVARDTTDTLTNKTLDLSYNYITDINQGTGDLLKNNGSSFTRFGMGSALQILRVNAGASDLEWATATGNSNGPVNTIQTSDGSGQFLAPSNILASETVFNIGVPVASLAAALSPFRFKVATIDLDSWPNNTDYTLTSSQYECPILSIIEGNANGAPANIKLVLPAVTGGFLIIINNTASSGIKIKDPGGTETATSVNSGHIGLFIHNGVDWKNATTPV